MPPKTRLRSRRWLVQTSHANSGLRDTFTVLPHALEEVLLTAMLRESHRAEGRSCTSIVEPNDAALRCVESLVLVVHRDQTTHTHREPEERMEDICRSPDG